MTSSPVLTPRLIVNSAAEAIEFYQRVFGAEEIERYAAPGGKIVHAAISIRGALISLADADDNWYPPENAAGYRVLLSLSCDDPDATAALAAEHGATIAIPVADRFYGRREGRIQDPFGHLWILSRPIAAPTAEEIQRGVDEFGDAPAPEREGVPD